MAIYSSKSSGFSLVEMSIVLVIVALIMAGAFQGINLLKSARMRAVVSEVTELKISLNSFYAKYDQFPGDFDEAEDYWGSSKTDNGDNDSEVDYISNDVYEGYRAWQHLTLAKMIEYNFLGTETTGVAQLGVDIPPSSYKGGFYLGYNNVGLSEDNVLVYGMPIGSDTAVTVSGVLNPSQAMEIDTKMDDGNPSTGGVRADDGNGSASESCVDDPSNDGANKEDFYKISVDGIDCILGIRVLNQ